MGAVPVRGQGSVVPPLFDALPDALAGIDLDAGRVRFTNAAWHALLGGAAQTWAGRHLRDLQHIGDGGGGALHAAQLAPGVSGRLILRRLDGTRVLTHVACSRAEVDGRPCLIASARPALATAIARHSGADGTDEHRFLRLAETIVDGLVEVDMTGQIVFENEAYRAIVGYDSEELRRLTYRDLTPVAWHAFEERIVREQVLARGHSAVYEKEYRRKDGSIVPVELRTVLLQDDAGRPSGMWAVVRDVTARRLGELALTVKEAALVAERDQLRQILDSLQAYAVMLELDGSIVYANRAVLALTGQSAGEVIGRKIWDADWVPPESVEASRQVVAAAATGEAVRRDIVAASGAERRDVDLVVSPVRGADGGVIRLASFGMDVTERRRAEEELRHASDRLREAQAMASIGSWELDVATGAVWWSDEMYRIFDAERGQFAPTGETVLRFVHEDDRAAVMLPRGPVESGREGRTTFRLVMPDGTLKWAETTWATELAADRSIRHARGTLQDITGRVVAQQALERVRDDLAASVAEKEVLLREIHHRVKNNLQIVSSLLYFLTRSATNEVDRAVIQDGHQRLRAMTLVHERLYQSPDLSRVAFGDYVGALARQLKDAYAPVGRRIDVTVDADDVHLPIGVAQPCGLMLCELVINAFRHAFGPSDEGRILMRIARAGGTLVLTVADSGRGWNDGTDPTQAGNFGWQMIRALCQQVGGTLSVDRGAGTAVSVTLPLPDARGAATSLPA